MPPNSKRLERLQTVPAEGILVLTGFVTNPMTKFMIIYWHKKTVVINISNKYLSATCAGPCSKVIMEMSLVIRKIWAPLPVLTTHIDLGQSYISL